MGNSVFRLGTSENCVARSGYKKKKKKTRFKTGLYSTEWLVCFIITMFYRIFCFNVNSDRVDPDQMPRPLTSVYNVCQLPLFWEYVRGGGGEGQGEGEGRVQTKKGLVESVGLGVYLIGSQSTLY